MTHVELCDKHLLRRELSRPAHADQTLLALEALKRSA
jgi:hypothetical protein